MTHPGSMKWTWRDWYALATVTLSVWSSIGAQVTYHWEVSCESGEVTFGYLQPQPSPEDGDFLFSNCTTSSGDQHEEHLLMSIDSGLGSLQLVINDVSGALDVNFAEIPFGPSLTVLAGNGSVAPTVIFTDEGGLATSTSLYFLSLNGVNFEDKDATLILNEDLAYLSVSGSNAVNISLQNDNPLETLYEMNVPRALGGSFEAIPYILYQANYSSVNGFGVFEFTPDSSFSITTDAVELAAEYIENLIANIGDLSTIGILCTETSGGDYICSSSDGVLRTRSQDSTDNSGSSSSSTSAPISSDSSASTGSENGSSSSISNGGLSTALIVVVVIVVVVVLVLLVFLVRCCRSRRAEKATTNLSDNTVALVSSDRLAMGSGDRENNKSNLWEDENIVSWRVPRNMVNIGPLISCGGYGEVFRGTYNGQDVAIKMLLPETRRSVKHVNAFLAEVKLMAVLEHVRIVQFVGVAWNSFNDLCALSEFMTGGDLRTLLSHYDETKHRQGYDHDKIKIALHVAHALTYLHSLSQPVIYRDLKSKNVLLTPELDAKLTDFGVSRERVDRTMTAGVGTSLWMAPEVMTGARYSEAADMFSFGVLLSELDTQMLPYSRARESGDLGRKVPDVTIFHMVAMGSLRVDFSSRALQEVVALGIACVSTDPTARPSSAEALYKLQTILQRL